jgi:hypothetical protein
MDFTESGQHINPARIAPSRITVQPTKTKTGSSNKRFHIGPSVAVCITAGMCYNSSIVDYVYTSGNDPWVYKHIHVILHTQDWERWEAFMCHCFGEPFMYTSMIHKAVQFSTIKLRPRSLNPGK